MLLIVNSKEEMLDTSQQYVLASTGTIWQYSSKTITTNPTNKIPLSITSDGSPFNSGRGWKNGYFINAGTGAESANSQYECTGFIPVKATDTFRIKNFNMTSPATSYDNVSFYKSDFTFIGAFTNSSSANPLSQFISNGIMEACISTAGTTNFTADKKNNIAYMRLSFNNITDSTFLTVNQPLEPTTETISDWYDTGLKYQDTTEEVARLEASVAELKETCYKIIRYMGLHQ
jgi:hypothetical protein